jgi:hypothetical protein
VTPARWDANPRSTDIRTFGRSVWGTCAGDVTGVAGREVASRRSRQSRPCRTERPSTR